MIIGIDPGKSGGIAVLETRDKLLYATVTPMPETDRDLYNYLRSITHKGGQPLAFLEQVSASPQMGVSSAFSFGQSYGALKMAIAAAGIRLELVSPFKWQSALGLILKGSGRRLGRNDGEKKRRNKARAQELFPLLTITNATADALLIAEYGRRVTVC